MDRAFYANTDVAGWRKFQVAVFNDDRQDEAGMIATGYFEEIRAPERQRPTDADERR